MKYDFQDLLNSVEQKFTNNNTLFDPYITHIRFPHYKMLAEGSIIHFTHPMTVLVGANGTNKTSILQALYGCPYGQSLSTYWFSTDVDKIDEQKKHSVIHGYVNRRLNKVVESLTTRIGVKKGQDYWESSRPIETFGMDMTNKDEFIEGGNKSTTRWDAINKKTTFIDCKNYYSAFDLFFYLSEFAKSSRIPSRQSFLRGRSRHLRKVIGQKLKNYSYKGVERIVRNQELSSAVCEIASYILGKRYTEIRIVEHSLYDRFSNNKPAKTIFMKNEDIEYSEAFAGSGEARVVLIINDIYNAPPNSLILMDEPEISLHPAAIHKLKLFILDEIKKKSHQVVISTHSPTMVKGLPDSSIKVLYPDNNNKIEIKENISFYEAFYVIGQSEINKKTIIVEDALSKHIIDFYIDKFKPNLVNTFEVKYVPGGARSIVKQDVVSAAREQDNNRFFILDGDQDVLKNYDFNDDSIINSAWVEHQTVITSKIPEAYNHKLGEVIKVITGQKIDFFIDGGQGDNSFQKVECQKQFLDYWARSVFFFYETTPEKAILDELGCDYEGSNPKQFFSDYARREIGGDVGAPDIFNLQKRFLNTLYNKNSDSKIFKDVERIINIIIGR